jgi:acyl-CoA reductase-like NAD-dependent aldehyde dehydrogenase
MHITPMIINGRPVSTAASFGVIDPALGKVLAEVSAGTPAHVDAAVAAARAAFPGWSATPDSERQRLLHTLADALQAEMPALMALLTRETGKPLNGLGGAGSGMEVGGAVAWTRVTADLDLPVEIVQDDAVARVEVHRRPLGVVASITPWNWPLLIAVWHVIPALRAGNTVVIKPSEFAPLATLRFVELANGLLPPGVLNVVTGDGAVGAALVGHADVARIVFTGSTATGRRIMVAAAGRLKRLTLELGGNDAGIVLPDVDVAAVAPQLLAATLHNNGQTCACLKRLYVHESIYEPLCAELARLAAALVVGDGLAPETQLGPLQNRQQLAIVEELADDAHRRGARFLCGGHRLDRPGYFYAPTVIADVADDMRVAAEEQFGPLVPVLRYRDVDEAIARANACDAGLGGSVWGRDTARAEALAMRLECGSAWVNTHGAVQPDAPFGGIKQSGFGVEFGRHGLAEYTTLQTVKVMK